MNAAIVEKTELCSPWIRDSPSLDLLEGDSPLGMHTPCQSSRPV